MQYQVLVNTVLFLTTFKITFLSAWYIKGLDSTVPGEHTFRGIHDGWEHKQTFTNEWTVQVEGGEEVAQLVALELGYVYQGPVSHSILVLRRS